MSVAKGARQPANLLKVPWDLTEWVDKGTLWRWATEEVGSLNWANPELARFLEANPKFRPRLLFTVLGWCYATAVFESGEIVASAGREPWLFQACGERPLSEKEVARFRRENRALLRWLLVRLLRKALAVRMGLEGSWFPPGLRRVLEDSAQARLDLARQFDRGSSGF